MALAFAAAAAVSFGLLPGASKELAALPAGTAVAMSRAVLTLVDGKLLDILAADAPAEVVMGTGKAVAIESVITQHGRANPTDVRVVLESEASAGAIITPQTTTLIESALASNEERDLATSFNIDCTAAGTHTFSVTARIEPLNGAHTDPDLSNNQRSVSFEVTCLPCLHASQSLDLGDGTQITVAQALSGNYFGLGTGGATVAGNVLADGNVFLRSKATVQGNLTFAGQFYQQGDFSVTGAIVNGVVNFVSIPRQTVKAGTVDLALGPDASGSWQPGTYAGGLVGNRSTLRLSAGTYHFRTLQVESDARVVANTSGGDVRIHIQQSVGFGDRSSLEKTAAGNVFIYTNATGLVRVGTDARFQASLRAPQAYVQVSSRAAIKGCVSARAISYAPQVTQQQF